jgi:hypothetical protein
LKYFGTSRHENFLTEAFINLQKFSTGSHIATQLQHVFSSNLFSWVSIRSSINLPTHSPQYFNTSLPTSEASSGDGIIFGMPVQSYRNLIHKTELRDTVYKIQQTLSIGLRREISPPVRNKKIRIISFINLGAILKTCPILICFVFVSVPCVKSELG